MLDEASLTLFLPNLGGGGSETVMLRLAGEFARRVGSVDLVVTSRRGALEGLLHPSVRLVDLGTGRVSRSVIPLARHLRRRKPDAVLSTTNHANLAAVAARALSGTRTRLALRQGDTVSRMPEVGSRRIDRWMPFLVRQAYRYADVILPNSKGVADDLVALLRMPAGRVRVIPNPVVDEAFFARASEPLADPWFEPGAPPVLIAVGRLAAQKDYPTMLRAFERIRAARPVRLLVLGEGDERASLETEVRRLTHPEDVRMPGFVDNPVKYVARAALLLLSSRTEGLPNALIEAVAVGCPVVATDCPSGPREILQDGRFGPLVPVGDARALADAALATLRNPPDPEALRARGRDFSVGPVVEAYLEVLLGPRSTRIPGDREGKWSS